MVYQTSLRYLPELKWNWNAKLLAFAEYTWSLYRFRLQQNDIGCRKGTIFTGALCYADDLLLLCPTIRGLQKMITICSEFATEYDVIFNPSKTACMAFGNGHAWPDSHLYLNGKMLEWTETFKHLGNVITVDQKVDSDIQVKRGQFYRSVNGLCYKFKGTLLNKYVATRLFQTYCFLFAGAKPGINPVLVLSLYAQHGIRLHEEFSIYHTKPIDIFFHL